MKEEIRGGIFQSVIDYIRKNHADEIDDAYEYFWEEDDPEEFLGGTAIDLGFVNFEDWLVCDYRGKNNTSLIDVYITKESPDEETKKALTALRDSVISLYEVVSSNEGKTLKDLLLEEEFTSEDKALERLNVGDIFATRFVDIDGERVMGRCVYPFNQGLKETIFQYIDRQYERYVKHKNTSGTMRDFLKEEAYAFNLIWISSLYKRP